MLWRPASVAWLNWMAADKVIFVVYAVTGGRQQINTKIGKQIVMEFNDSGAYIQKSSTVSNTVLVS